MFLKWNYRETFCWFNILFRLIKHRYCLRQMRIWGSTFCLWYIRWTGLIGYYLKVHMPCVIIKFIDDILNLTNSIILVCSIPERILLQHQSDCVPFFSWQTWNQKKVSLEFFFTLNVTCSDVKATFPLLFQSKSSKDSFHDRYSSGSTPPWILYTYF